MKLVVMKLVVMKLRGVPRARKLGAACESGVCRVSWACAARMSSAHEQRAELLPRA